MTGREVLAATLVLGLTTIASQRQPGDRAPAVIGLDHVPIAVRDLEAAAETYRALGFSLKPGQPHRNGIRNQHVKFPDGTELELITAPEARDALTTKYRRHLEHGDGPAFLALFTPDAARAPQGLHASLHYLFFGARNASPTDRPEHFAHANTATSLISVWLAGENLEQERMLFTRLGATISRREVDVPGRIQADVAQFREGDVLLLPASHQRVKGRPIVGATVRVRRLEAVRDVLQARKIQTSAAPASPSKSIFVAPEHAHGLWLEFREAR
jgi:catechol 2,3-dioxygenase-like lactoylglutathione lyase family enzyme